MNDPFRPRRQSHRSTSIVLVAPSRSVVNSPLVLIIERVSGLAKPCPRTPGPLALAFTRALDFHAE